MHRKAIPRVPKSSTVPQYLTSWAIKTFNALRALWSIVLLLVMGIGMSRLLGASLGFRKIKTACDYMELMTGTITSHTPQDQQTAQTLTQRRKDARARLNCGIRGKKVFLWLGEEPYKPQQIAFPLNQCHHDSRNTWNLHIPTRLRFALYSYLPLTIYALFRFRNHCD